MNFKSAFALIAVCAALGACSSSGPTYKETDAKMAAIKPGQGRIFFYRPSGLVSGALSPDVKLNGTIVGESKQGGFFYVDVLAGKHEVSTGTDATSNLSFNLERGEIKYVRTKVSVGITGGRVVPELVSGDMAQPELASTTYTGR